MKTILKLLILLIMSFMLSCGISKKHTIDDSRKAWAWMSGKLSHTDEVWDYYFRNASKAGIDAILLECHPGVPDTTYLRDDFVGAQAIETVKRALPYARKYNIELHAWMWTENRGELNLRKAHPEWYMVNRDGKSVVENKLYGREHYRFLCPYHPEVTEYLKDRASELAEIDGLAGVHLDFIRYPDVILPSKLQASRGVVQDKEYAEWDHCYCDLCRSLFKEKTGIDPIEMEDPSQNKAWKQFRYDGIVHVASEVCKAIKEKGKIASVAVFPHPDTARTLVRQDWPRFRNIDYIFPMVYHKFYTDEDSWITEATRAGLEELKANNNPAKECTGLFVPHIPVDSISYMIDLAIKGGSTGICFFSLEGIKSAEDKGIPYWEKLGRAINEFKKK
ncbi:putative glycoside hydrolase [Dysgonomonas sp.]